MPDPDDFGLTPVQTLSRVAGPARVPHFNGFWSAWRDPLGSLDPRLTPARDADPSDPDATHTFESVRSVRIGCTLVPAKGATRATLVTSHGYACSRRLRDEPARWARIAERGVAVLAIRLRGFPGSQLDTGDLTAPDQTGCGWITRGLDAPADAPEAALDWIVPQAVADLVNALRAVRAEFGPRTPLYLHGESLGAGLGIIAAAQADDDARPERLVAALPSLGDWPWRAAHPAGGAGAEVRALLVRHADRERALLERIGLADATAHAAMVHAPTLAKLALRDDAVPAPTQAAVYNAVAADPGRKWRFLVQYGHHDGGIADARRHALFEQCVADFLDPTRTPRESMVPWEPLLGSGDRPPQRPWISDEAAAQGALFEPEPSLDDKLLIDAYAETGRTLDDLPYTPEFDALYTRVSDASPPTTQREVFHRLHNLRKAGKLPRLGRAATTPVRLNAEEEQVLVSLVERFAGSLGQRDRLIYTPEFDLIVEKLNAETGHALDPHAAWRLVAKLAK